MSRDADAFSAKRKKRHGDRTANTFDGVDVRGSWEVSLTRNGLARETAVTGEFHCPTEFEIFCEFGRIYPMGEMSE